HALAAEDVGDAARVRELAAVASQCRSHLGCGPVAVVGEALDQDGHTGGGIPLVDDGLPVGTAGCRTAAALDGVGDVVVGDAVLLGLLDGVDQSRVAGEVTASAAGGHLGVLDHLAEKLAAPCVDNRLLVLGGRPFGVAAHRFSLD